MKGPENKVLFLFTKMFPYGRNEQYLVDEIPVLAQKFSRIIVVPAELFSESGEPRPLPPNVNILNINQEASQLKFKSDTMRNAGILMNEFSNEKDKARFIKEFRRYRSVLRHQDKLAAFMQEYLTKFRSNDLYFYTYWLHNSSILLGLLKKKGIILNYVSRAHAIDIFHNDWPTAYNPGTNVLPFQYFKTKMATVVSSISQDGTRYLKNKYPAMAEKFKTYYLGIADRGPGNYDPAGVFTIASCSSVTSRKRVLKIAEIFKKLKFPATWVHFGTGNEMEELKFSIAELPKHLKVELRGFTANPEVLNYYKTNSVNLFINLSTAEGIPVSIMEAGMFGIPCLATDVNGNSEALPTGSNLLIKNDFKTEEVTALIEAFAADPNLQTSLREATRAHCLAYFNDQKNYLDFANELLNWKN